jgi:SAM-dependent methyltransferase
MSVLAAADYDPFAWFYDEYWCSGVTGDFVRSLDRLLLPRLAEGARLLDLCCGTGRVAAELDARGFRVSGLDLSEEMLRLARRNAPRVEFFSADARDFAPPHAYDAVVSTFDSINHILSLAELSAVFRNVRRALAPAAPFFFDVNMEMGFRDHWQEHFSVVEDKRVCLVRGSYDGAARLGRYDFTLFGREGELWRRSDFSIAERCYTRRELKRALAGAGFGRVEFYDAVRDAGLIEHTGRVFVLAETGSENGGRPG